MNIWAPGPQGFSALRHVHCNHSLLFFCVQQSGMLKHARNKIDQCSAAGSYITPFELYEICENT